MYLLIPQNFLGNNMLGPIFAALQYYCIYLKNIYPYFMVFDFNLCWNFRIFLGILD
jgi:hypothetical protein